MWLVHLNYYLYTLSYLKLLLNDLRSIWTFSLNSHINFLIQLSYPTVLFNFIFELPSLSTLITNINSLYPRFTYSIDCFLCFLFFSFALLILIIYNVQPSLQSLLVLNCHFFLLALFCIKTCQVLYTKTYTTLF